MNQATREHIKNFCQSISQEHAFPEISGVLQNEGYLNLDDLSLLEREEWAILGFGNTFQAFKQYLAKNINLKASQPQASPSNKKNPPAENRKEINKRQLAPRSPQKNEQSGEAPLPHKQNQPSKTIPHQSNSQQAKQNSIQTVTGLEKWNTKSDPILQSAKPPQKIAIQASHASGRCLVCKEEPDNSLGSPHYSSISLLLVFQTYSPYFSKGAQATLCKSCYLSGKTVPHFSAKIEYVRRVMRDFSISSEEANLLWTKFVYPSTSFTYERNTAICNPYQKVNSFLWLPVSSHFCLFLAEKSI